MTTVIVFCCMAQLLSRDELQPDLRSVRRLNHFFAPFSPFLPSASDAKSCDAGHYSALHAPKRTSRARRRCGLLELVYARVRRADELPGGLLPQRLDLVRRGTGYRYKVFC